MNLRVSDIVAVPAFLATVAGTATALGCHTFAISGIQTLREKDNAWLRRRASYAQSLWTDATLRSAMRCLALSLFVDADPRTEDLIQANPVLVVSNHQSFLDVPLIASLLRERGKTDLRWIIKDDIKGWPFIGYSCRTNGSAFVTRDLAKAKHDLGAVRDCARLASAENASIAVFPEGTRFKADPAFPERHVLPPHPAAVTSLIKHLPNHVICSLTLCHNVNGPGRTIYIRMKAFTRDEIGRDVRAWLEREWEDKDLTIASMRR